MSKIGKKPILIPQGVAVDVKDRQVEVSGPKGKINFIFRPEIQVELKDSLVHVTRNSQSKFARALHGLTRSLIANMVKGVTVGHQKTLEIVGVGYRAAKEGEELVLNIGYSHPVVIPKTDGIEIDTKDNKVVVSGIDKTLVGEIAARIRRVRPPEPYKGKGIKYQDEIIRRKAGKAVKGATGQ